MALELIRFFFTRIPPFFLNSYFFHVFPGFNLEKIHFGESSLNPLSPIGQSKVIPFWERIILFLSVGRPLKKAIEKDSLRRDDFYVEYILQEMKLLIKSPRFPCKYES